MPEIYPSQLLELARNGVLPESEVAVDTETSGLFVDDGARVSTVSVAFTDVGGRFADLLGDGRFEWGGGIHTRRPEVVFHDGTEVTIASFAWPYDQGVADTGKAEDNGYATMWPDAENLPESEFQALLEWLAIVGANLGLTMHHAKFDEHMLEAGTRRWPGIGRDLAEFVVWDTQNVASLIYPTQVKVMRQGKMVPTSSLKPVSAWLWGEAETDEQTVIKKYLLKKKLPMGRWDLMPWDIIAKYAEDDARKTIRLQLRQMDDMLNGTHGQWLDGKNGRMRVNQAVRRRLDTSHFLRRMERRGLPFNTESALSVAGQLDQKEAELVKALPFSPPTLPRAKTYWFDELGLTPYSVTEKNSPQINEAIINKMVARDIDGAATWRDLQKVRTANERWYSGYASMAGSDGRLRASVRQNGTVSGRFSVERLQLQAIPHDYRLSAFGVLDGLPTPREIIAQGVPKGYKLWELDLAQAELRVAALYAGCQTMLDLIDAGEDLHAVTARLLFSIDESDPQWGKMRTIAKRSNFGLIFGSGWETFQADLEKQTGIILSDKAAQKLVREWNALYPEFKAAIYKHQRAVEGRMKSADYGRGVGWITLPNGERRWWVPGEDTHKAFNQRVQPSLAQYGIDWWLWSERFLMDQFGDDPIYEYDTDPETGEQRGVYVGRVGLVLVIHDSQVLLLPDNARGEEAVQRIVEYGRELWADRFPGVPGDVDAKEWGKAA